MKRRDELETPDPLDFPLGNFTTLCAIKKTLVFTQLGFTRTLTTQFFHTTL
jgi:hypothetical protein